MKDGVIADFTATQLMLKNIMKKIVQRHNLGKPRVVVGVPSELQKLKKEQWRNPYYKQVLKKSI